MRRREELAAAVAMAAGLLSVIDERGFAEPRLGFEVLVVGPLLAERTVRTGSIDLPGPAGHTTPGAAVPAVPGVAGPGSDRAGRPAQAGAGPSCLPGAGHGC